MYCNNLEGTLVELNTNGDCNDSNDAIHPVATRADCAELVDLDLLFVEGWPFHDDCEELDDDCDCDDDCGDDCDDDDVGYDTRYENGWYPGCDF